MHTIVRCPRCSAPTTVVDARAGLMLRALALRSLTVGGAVYLLTAGWFTVAVALGATAIAVGVQTVCVARAFAPRATSCTACRTTSTARRPPSGRMSHRR